MSCRARLPVRSLHAVRGWRAAPAAWQPARSGVRQVEAGADQGGTAGWVGGIGSVPRRRAASAPDTPECTFAATRQGSAAPCMVDASARRETDAWCLGGWTARTAPRATLAAAGIPGISATGRGRPVRVRGAGRSLWRTGDAARGHGIGKGQGTFCAAHGTEIQCAVRGLQLSRCESLINALDLQSATLGNKSDV
jgi:hypothetical protein